VITDRSHEQCVESRDGSNTYKHPFAVNHGLPARLNEVFKTGARGSAQKILDSAGI